MIMNKCTVPIKDVLKLIQTHTEKDNKKFEETAFQIAKDIEPNDPNGEFALWIYAQFGLGAWVPMEKSE